jgi:hypothetical protein
MATLVLTTLGTALGGPVGGALGSIIGQSIDRNLFGPAARRGPRLGDLRVQTSSYGTPIPRIYGRMRIAGTVVWATELREQEVASAASKGGAGAVNYAYSASFAVALSSRGAPSVRRIWADGKLLRAADGTFQSKVGFRFLNGSEQQAVDPLIASIEGVDRSPAFRGMALAVFEDLALADYGNRIPSLTFELVADEAPPRVAEVISDIARGAVEAGTDPRTLVGFAALGTDRRSAIEPLVDLWGGHYFDDGSVLRASEATGSALTIGDPRTTGCIVDGDRPAPRVLREHEPADALPAVVTIEYYDPERDYQTGQMRASAALGGRSVRRIDSASAIDAATAKSLASDALARRWTGRDRVTLRLSPSFAGVRPGQAIVIDSLPGRYRIEQVVLDGLVVVVEARRLASSAILPGADPGRATSYPGVAVGASVPLVLELPTTGWSSADGFGVMVAVGSKGRFRPVTIEVEANGQPVATLAVDRAAVTGIASSPLAPGPAFEIDRVNEVDVVLSDPDRFFYHADDDALAMGANTILIGDEVIQFGRAAALGGVAFRLSRLIRGCRGTEWAIESHVAGERVVLIEPDRLFPVTLDPAMIGADIVVRAFGRADDVSDLPTATTCAAGESLRPLGPCHASAAIVGTEIKLEWTRRRWGSVAWPSAGEAGVEAATFEVIIRRAGQSLRRVAQTPELSVQRAEIDALGAGRTEFEITEQGVVPSRPALLSIAS